VTLKLVADNTVTELPIVNVADIAANLRLLADTIERGDLTNLRSCVFVLVTDDGLSIHVKGENCSSYELMGLFEAAKLRVFADGEIDDE
jgi:hypothetical protein